MISFFETVTLPTVAGTVFALLLDLTVKGVLLLALAGLLTTVFKRTSAASRHLIWALALCSVLLLPVLTVTLPAWRMPVVPEVPLLQGVTSSLERAYQPLESAPLPAPADLPIRGTHEEARPVPVAPAATPAREGVVANGRAVRPAHEAIFGAFAELYDEARSAPWTVWVLFIWLGGVALVMFRFLIGASGVLWLAFRARPVKDQAWINLADEVGDRVFVRRRVRLLRSTRTAMPMTWGILRPVVLLPVSANDWPEARRWCVLTHEFAHIKRWDCLTQMLAQFACALSWFNPLVWIAARRMREEREIACDDYVLRCGTKASTYATHLLEIARSTRSTVVVPLGAVSMARPSQLEGRVLSILDAARVRGKMGRLATVAGFVFTAILVLPLAAMRPAGPASGAAAASLDAGTHTLRKVMTEQGEVYRWSGRVGRGHTVEIRGILGDVQAAPSSGTKVDVVALYEEGASARNLIIIEHEDGLVVCMSHPVYAGKCASDVGGRDRKTEQPRVDFLVRIPEGVHFSGETVNGDIRAVGLRNAVGATTVDGDIVVQTLGTVSARTVDGDIDLRTSSYARASTVDGNINARIGRTSWSGKLPFSSVTGDISVELPADASTDIDLHVESDGYLRSAVGLQRRSRGNGEHFKGRLGSGGRQLSLHTVKGNVTISHLGKQPLKTSEEVDVRVRKEPERNARPRSSYRAEDRSARQQPRYAFNDQSVEERLRAVRQFAEVESETAVEKLSYILVNDPSSRVRERAASTLGDIACYQAVPALLAALNDEETAVRRKAVWALSMIEDERAVAALAHALQDTDARVSSQAQQALDRIGFEEQYRTVADETNAADVILDADLQRLSLQIGDLDIALSGNLFSVAAKAINALDLGLEVTDRDLFELAQILGEDDPYARKMAQLGLDDFTREELLLARFFGVDAAYVHAIHEAGYDPTLGELIQLKVAGIGGTYLSELADEGYGELPVDELIALRQLGLDKEIIYELEEQGIYAPTVEEMVEYQSSRATSDDLQPNHR
ncbi:MAG: M56 family metallopeptidase [Rhodothermales bacterium]